MVDMRINKDANFDKATVEGFGDEWARFDQSAMEDGETRQIFEDYFSNFPWSKLNAGAVGVDVGCGSGRWALLMAGKVGRLHLLDASDKALDVARRRLAGHANTHFHLASVGDMPFADGSLDFAYSLGVLHHVPDTGAAIKAVARKLKPGAPFLIYLYYAFDNQPFWYRAIWKCSDFLRRIISRLPFPARYLISQGIAAAAYWPLARLGKVLDRAGLLPDAWPLRYYRDKSFYVMRTDALDRFGTRLEKRFTQAQIQEMLAAAGFGEIRFSDAQPYWCALGIKATNV